MELDTLTAISPIDGRYRNKVVDLSQYFSECALIKYRVTVELEYFIALCELPLLGLEDFKKENFPVLRDIFKNFSVEEAQKVKEKEKVTNHDVKAVEYFIKDRFAEKGWTKWSEFIHFGLTSQDINNTAFPLMIKEAVTSVYMPLLLKLRDALNSLSEEYKDIPMLARTHGQPATPTSLGKEIAVKFADRYYDAVAPGDDFIALDVAQQLAKAGKPWTKALAFDYSLAIGEWINIGDWTLDQLVLTPEEAIALASKVMTIRQGDLIYIQTKQAPRPVQKEEILRTEVNGEEKLYCKIK